MCKDWATFTSCRFSVIQDEVKLRYFSWRHSDVFLVLRMFHFSSEEGSSVLNTGWDSPVFHLWKGCYNLELVTWIVDPLCLCTSGSYVRHSSLMSHYEVWLTDAPHIFMWFFMVTRFQVWFINDSLPCSAIMWVIHMMAYDVHMRREV